MLQVIALIFCWDIVLLYKAAGQVNQALKNRLPAWFVSG